MFAILARPAWGAVALMSLAAAAIGGPARADGPDPSPGMVTTVSLASDYEDIRAVKLGLNKSIVVDMPRDARDVLVSNPSVADAVIRTPRRIYLTGIAVGQTNIIVFDRAGQQIVSIELEIERDTRNLESVLDRFIPNSYIVAETINDNIVLSGSVKTAADARRAEDIATMFANGGQNSKAGEVGTDGKIRTSGVINLLTIEGEDQVHLKVTIAEIERRAVKQLGIDWNLDNLNLGDLAVSAFTGIMGATNSEVSISDDGATVTAAIQALERGGVLRTLAEPTLTAISGEQASFHAGGEVAIEVDQGDGRTGTEWKEFGVRLSFVPVVLSEGRISLKIGTEVSELTDPVQGRLALNTRKANTTLELPSGGAMVLGGLLQDTVRQSIQGVPGLKKLPILGTLFRSRDYQRRETELVIFVTPYLVKPMTRDQIARPDDGFSSPDDIQSTFLGRLNNVYGGEGRPAPSGTYVGRYGYIYE